MSKIPKSRVCVTRYVIAVSAWRSVVDTQIINPAPCLLYSRVYRVPRGAERTATCGESRRSPRRWSSRGPIPLVSAPSACMFMHCIRTWKRPLMPPTGSSGLPWRWHPRPSCMPRGARHPGGEADRWSRCRGRAARPPAGTSGWHRGSRTGSGMAGTSAGRLETPGQSGAGGRTPARDHPAGRGSGRWPAPRASRWSRPGAVQVAGAQDDAAAWSVRVPVPASR
jgi:hypothetical protein